MLKLIVKIYTAFARFCVGVFTANQVKSSTLLRSTQKDKGAAYYKTGYNISKNSSPLDIGNIFGDILCADQKSSDRAAVLVGAIMKKVTCCQWKQLYKHLRHIGIQQEHVAKLASYHEDIAIELLGVATFSSNGYVRQAAILEMSKFSISRKIPYILLRLGDWVPQVYDAAQYALGEIFDSGQILSLLEYSYLIDSLGQLGRRDLSNVQDEIMCRFRNVASTEEFIWHLKKGDVRIRKYCFRALAQDKSNIPAIVDIAVSEPSSTIRKWVVQYVIKLPHDKALGYIIKLLQDKSYRVCTEILRWLPDGVWEQVREIVVGHIFSKSVTVRASARFVLRSHGIENFPLLYRQEMSKSVDITRGIIAGLGETGDKSDFDSIAVHVNHSKSHIREAALKAMGNWDASKSSDSAFMALNDTNVRVRRVAIDILKTLGAAKCKDRLLLVLDNSNPKAQIAALAVLASFGGIERLRDILYCLVIENNDLRDYAWQHLKIWADKHAANTYLRPDNKLLSEIIVLHSQIKSQIIKRYSEKERIYGHVSNYIQWASNP